MSAQIFFKIDLQNAYYWICIVKKNEWKTMFQIQYKHFEYNVLFFELYNASIIFQIYINKILQKLLNIFYIIYLNDILVFLKNKVQHVKHLQLIMNKLQKHKFYIKLIKYKFFITKMKFLKFIMSMNRMSMNFSQIDIIINWLEFKIFQKIQIFLSFMNFYWQFIHNYSHMIELLINFLKKNKTDKKIKLFTFTKKTWETFTEFKKIFKTAFLLMYFNFQKKMQIKADALKIVIEAIFS